MAYKFNFDFSSLPKSFFKEIARISQERKIHKKIGAIAIKLSEKFKIHERTGIPFENAIEIIEDLIDVYTKNIIYDEKFKKGKKRALFLPHCARKYMDNRCKAKFNKEFSTYSCNHCSNDCLVNKSTKIAKKAGYDVYILPGGSCVQKILSKKRYDSIVGVACCEEIKLAYNYLEKIKIPAKGIPLTKNGCANTKFDLKLLKEVLTS
ncbi:MAG: DUF116 domain-containing protein [Candidatus Aenigmatarchaeota archaeon]